YGSVTKLDSIADSILSASQEQSNGIKEISEVIIQMDDATQKTSKVAGEAAGYSRELTNQSDNIRTLVTVLDGIINGSQKELKHVGVLAPNAHREHSKSETVKPTFKAKKSKDKPAAKTNLAVVKPLDVTDVDENADKWKELGGL